MKNARNDSVKITNWKCKLINFYLFILKKTCYEKCKFEKCNLNAIENGSKTFMKANKNYSILHYPPKIFLKKD